MFAHLRVRRAWLAFLVVPGLISFSSGSAAAASPSSCSPLQKFQQTAFPAVPKINNRFFPLTPGTQLVLDGFVTGDDGLRHPHQIETTTTNLTKVIDGVRTIAVFDRDFEDGVLIESEVFFEAQAKDGAVWNVGEYPEEYENGSLVGAPSTWISGVAGAKAGIAMLASPTVGSPAYLQGTATSVGFKDCASVFATGQRTCTPIRCFDGVLITDEFAPLDPAGGHQRKFYAPGVGNIRVADASGIDPEALGLTKFAKLCSRQLARINALVVQQDQRGYSVSPNVYGKTPTLRATLPAPTC